eukprot:jgi/Astpho2/7279/fgenesh1_pg.00113_%23_83_t
MPIFCRHLAISCLLLCPAELCGRLAPAQSSPLAADPSKEVDVAIELVAEGSLAEGQHDMQVAQLGSAPAEEAAPQAQLPAFGGSPSRSEKVGSTGTPPKGPERLCQRRRRAPDASQQQQHASASQGNKRQRLQRVGQRVCWSELTGQLVLQQLTAGYA